MGETLHLVDPEPLSARELVTTLSRAYAGREPRGQRPAGAGRRQACAREAVREFFGGTPRESIAYLNHAVTFDTRARSTCSTLGLAPPRFADYVDAMVGYFKLNEARK